MCKCANCGGRVTNALYDDRAELYFCDEQCFREWATEAGEETVLAFYRAMNISEITN